MSEDTLLSLGLGVLVGLVYGGLVFVVLRRARNETGARFMRIVLGGMVVRFFVLLVLVGVILALVSVRAGIFVAALVPLLILFVALEIVSLMRRAQST